MGLANLVPGISGGTMLLAAGVYEPFVNAIAEITTGKFRFRSLVLLASVGCAAGLGILLLAGVLKELVVQHRWVMYSLFIGLTLGGLPIVLRMVRPITRGAVVASVVAFALMAGLAVLQALGIVGSFPSNVVILFLSGVAGASAMILPGLSGGYLLLLLGQYVPILSGIHEFKEALGAGDLSAAMPPALSVMLPVGIGVLIGVAAVSNVLHWFLHHHRKSTLGVLIGLLLGSVVGLWPFQTYLEPTVGQTVVKGQLVTEDNVADFDREDWPTQWFRPSLGHVAASLALIGVGIGITLGVAALGGSEEAKPEQAL
jgi:putative membrane protein